MAGVKIRISTWNDIVSDESASNGDYESMGEDQADYYPETLRESIDWFNRELQEISAECPPVVNDVVYDTDPIIDYSNGDETYHRLIISVDGSDKKRVERVVRALQYLIKKTNP